MKFKPNLPGSSKRAIEKNFKDSLNPVAAGHCGPTDRVLIKTICSRVINHLADDGCEMTEVELAEFITELKTKLSIIEKQFITVE